MRKGEKNTGRGEQKKKTLPKFSFDNRLVVVTFRIYEHRLYLIFYYFFSREWRKEERGFDVFLLSINDDASKKGVI